MSIAHKILHVVAEEGVEMGVTHDLADRPQSHRKATKQLRLLSAVSPYTIIYNKCVNKLLQ